MWLAAGGSPAATRELRGHHMRRVARELPAGPLATSQDDLVAWLGAHEWAPNTRRAYRATVRAFYRWCVECGHLDTSPAAGLPPIKVPRGRPRPTPEDDYRAALAAADERVRVAVLLGGACGLRRGEIARVRREDVEHDLLGWCLRVEGKGGHVRLVPLPDQLAALLLAQDPGWIFPNPATGTHLTPHHLGKIVSRVLPDGMTTHTLRHRCATVAYAALPDLRAVQELLGHARPETTAIYTAVAPDNVRRLVAVTAA